MQESNDLKRREQMKSVGVAMLGTFMLLGGVAMTSGRTATLLAGTNSAAFRDGQYLGQIAAARGELPHVAMGRWGSETDRQLFAAGYEKGYAEELARASAKRVKREGGDAGVAAYRDGLYNGVRDATKGSSLHLALGRWSAEEDRSAFASGYNQGFAEVQRGSAVQTASVR